MSSLTAETRVRRWVAERDHLSELPLTDTTPLFADRRLTSLDLPELLVLLEEVCERTLTIDDVTADRFADLAAILAAFVPGLTRSELAVYGHVTATLDRLAAGPGASSGESAVTEQHPVLLPRPWLTRSGWLGSFPQLAVFADGAADADGCDTDDADPSESAVFAPAACHAVFATRAGRDLAGTERVHVRGRVFRNEDHTDGLRRLRAFTMDERVLLGTGDDVETFLDRGQADLSAVFDAWGIEHRWQVATDPFYRSDDPAALLQRVLPVKYEAVVVCRDGRELAIASANRHFDHFGTAFGITRAGAPVTSGCLAVGVERVVWAWLHAHGPNHDRPELADLATPAAAGQGVAR